MEKEEAINEGYKNLATEIVASAIRDYVHPTTRVTKADKEYLPKFFSSQWCQSLSGMDTETLYRYIRRYKKQYEEIKNSMKKQSHIYKKIYYENGVIK